MPANRLAAGEKQKLELLKQLYLGRRFLILDEPTSVLTPAEADELLGMVRDLTRAGHLRTQPGEPSADIVPQLAPVSGEVLIDKPGKGAFYATSLDETLAELGLRQLVVAGVTTEVCVQTTMREANDRGYECVLASDATESYFPRFKTATLDMITAQGAIVGWTATTDSILGGISD